MSRECYHPFKDKFGIEEKCKNADILENGKVVCKSDERQKGWSCDYHSPHHLLTQMISGKKMRKYEKKALKKVKRFLKREYKRKG